jgi:hypothetical protein
MNLKFVDDIFKTIEVMKTGFYYLGLLIGVHTVTFTAYLAYKYLYNDKTDKKLEDKKPEDKKLEDNKAEDKKDELELPPPLTNNNEPVLQMEELTNSFDKKEVYKSLLEQKKEELCNLIVQLDTVYDNIGVIRERLEKLTTKSI